ncbi:MAG: riboflavin synthase [Leptolyngbyaceae cyanobacterium SL_7_1]|nr:riboflavin synthase [Leptolyngbyaceae cyanobacterium SL_7_1]
MALGDSVAVDGVCLTVTHILADGFIAAVSPETLARSTLAACSDRTVVNLEQSLRVGSKLGGHFVTGHVDGLGYLTESIVTATSWEMSFSVADERVSRYIVPKGSIAVNGVSLTVAECSSVGDWFKVAVIPLTFADTNLGYLQPGSAVNLEGDVLGKYVEKFLRLGGGQPSIAIDQSAALSRGETLSSLFLAEHGYL